MAMTMAMRVRVEEGRGIGPGGLKTHRCSRRCGCRRTSGRALRGRWFCIGAFGAGAWLGRPGLCVVRARKARAEMRISIFLGGSLI